MTATRMLFRAATLAALAAGWFLAAYLLWDSSTVPGDLSLPKVDPGTYVPEAVLDRADRFERFQRWNFVLATLALLATLAFYARRGHRFMRESAAGRVGTGMLLGMLGFALVWLAQLPFAIAGFWWYRRHDLAEGDYLEFVFGDWLVLGFTFLSLCLALLIVMGLAGVMGRWWWVLGGPAFVGIAALFLFLYPYLSDLDRPDDRALIVRARAIAEKAGVEGVPLRVEKVSDQTDLVNAWAAGLGPSRRVALWDTLLDGRFTDAQVDVVIAHEYGHHAHAHLSKGIAWYALFAIPGAFGIELLTRRKGGMRNPAAVPLSLFVLVALQLVATPLDNAITRHMEAEADWAALSTTRDPVAAQRLFAGFTRTSLSDPHPPTWSYILLETHPTIEQRIAMAEAWKKRARGTR
ncbi:MAG: M48 family metalloprotease [Gaiellaceae bacterium]